MQTFSKPIVDIIRQRTSCRTYLERPIERDLQLRIAEFAAAIGPGPLGGRARYQLIAADPEDSAALRQLGTYGFIKGATAFLVGATQDGQEKLEDFGFLLEKLVLFATDLGLGTCWLGGTFTKSSFAQRIHALPDELIPAVTPVGYCAPTRRPVDRLIRNRAGSDRRLPVERLFLDKQFSTPLSLSEAGDYALPLEMVRLAPSASNKQPWRIVRQANAWHFYLQRTPGYRDSLLNRVFTQADLQRADMGIAMCHFELTAKEHGLMGEWSQRDPGIEPPDEFTTYIVTWLSA
jgi:nitroreductase